MVLVSFVEIPLHVWNNSTKHIWRLSIFGRQPFTELLWRVSLKINVFLKHSLKNSTNCPLIPSKTDQLQFKSMVMSLGANYLRLRQLRNAASFKAKSLMSPLFMRYKFTSIWKRLPHGIVRANYKSWNEMDPPKSLMVVIYPLLHDSITNSHKTGR